MPFESAIDFFNDFLMTGGTVIAIVGGIFTITLILSSRKDAKEEGLIPIHRERCGGRIGWISFSWPFVRIAIYKDFMLIRAWRNTLIEYDKIRRLENVGLFGSGIEIVTTDIDTYGQPILYSFN